MRHFIFIFALALPAHAEAQARLDAVAAAILQEGLTQTADTFILPAYAQQSDAANDLSDDLTRYCDGSSDISVVHGSFADLFLAWQRSSIVQVGPIMEAEGPMRVQLWPDSKGFSQRAIRQAVNAEDPALLIEGGLDGRSIALTNLTALEALIYDDITPSSYACDLAIAIARFQSDLAGTLVEQWSAGGAFRSDFDTADTGNTRFASVEDVIRELLAGAVVYTDRLRKFKIERGLGEEPGDARPERTEAIPSGLGLDSIQVGFQTLADFYEAPYGLFDAAPEIGGNMEYYLLGEGASLIADGLSLQTASIGDIAAQDGPLAEELRRYADVLTFHETFLKTEFLGSVGITAGFTSADGD